MVSPSRSSRAVVVDLSRRVSSENLVGWESLHDPGAKVTPRSFNVLTEGRDVSKKIGGNLRGPDPWRARPSLRWLEPVMISQRILPRPWKATQSLDSFSRGATHVNSRTKHEDRIGCKNKNVNVTGI